MAAKKAPTTARRKAAPARTRGGAKGRASASVPDLFQVLRGRIASQAIAPGAKLRETELAAEFGIPARKVYSGDLCPDHAGVMVMRDAIAWAGGEGADLLLVESAGLCLRCSPYTTQALGIVVLSAISGTNTPLKMAAMLALADTAVVTRIDLVSQAEKEVFRERIREVNP